MNQAAGLLPERPPRVGELVEVRSRRWLVEGVEDAAPPTSPRVSLACADDDAQGQTLEVYWDFEIDRRILEQEAWSTIGARGFDPPRHFSAFLHTLRWSCVTATDPNLFQSPFRAGIKIDAYQMEPLRKALRLPRVNLFIADDTGLGKTIEAGLIARELLLRKKAKTVVVAAPASVLEQWKAEMEERFGLIFVILDRAYLTRVRQERGFGVNPWRTHSRFLVSHNLLIDPTYADPMREWLGEMQPGGLLILDEAHHAAPSSGGRYGIETKFTRAIRDLGGRFEHRLFLSATPHNGHSNSFSTLLELLDPYRFTRGVPVRGRNALDDVMVRRIKEDIREVQGGFPEREVRRIPIEDLPEDAPELVLSRLLDEYRGLREERLKNAPARARAAGGLLVVGLQQKLLSSIEAFAISLARHRVTVRKQWEQAMAGEATAAGVEDSSGTSTGSWEPATTAGGAAEADSGSALASARLFASPPDADDERAEYTDDDSEAEEAAQIATLNAAAEGEVAGDAQAEAIRRKEEALLDRMQEVASAARGLPDAKTRRLIEWIRDHLCPGLPCPCPTSRRWTSCRPFATVFGVEVQNQVGRTLRANLARVRDVLDGASSQGIGTVGRVADRVCEAFDFSDGRGHWQRASCHQALSDLEAAGHLSLPPSRCRGGVVRRARVLAQPVARACDVPSEVGELRDLALVRVETDEQLLVWNTLMAHEHPRGAGPFVGPQLRYLVGSAHGWLGGVGFAASARRLKARDVWIGWDDAHRRIHLHRVVGLCRCLIRPDVKCRNLASHVLGRAARAVGEDFERRYGYRPWLLETFVDEAEHRGTSLRAANWVRVGESSGRGRQDRTHAAPETPKAVYVYELEPAWRERLALPAPPPLAPGDGLDAESWAGNEFAAAALGDARLSARLVESARHMALSPMRAITGATNGARAVVKGHYRLIDQPAEGEVTVENILAPHRARTLQRMGSQETVLCVLDGTSLNFAKRGQTQGLGVIGSNQTGALARGLHLHTTLAVNPDGVPLGVLRAGFDAPPPPDPEAKGPKAREEKKSFRWIEGLRDCAQAAQRLPETHVVYTTDREADFLDLFIERREHAPHLELLVRAKVNRVLANDTTAEGDRVVRRLFDEVRNAPARGTCTVEVGRLSARVKASKQAPKAKRVARLAETTLRYEPVALSCPRSGAGRAVDGACARGARACKDRAAGVVRPHHRARDQRRRCDAHPPVVCASLAHRGLLPHPQVRLQGRGAPAPQRRAPRTRHRHQDGGGLAHPVDGPARARGA